MLIAAGCRHELRNVGSSFMAMPVARGRRTSASPSRTSRQIVRSQRRAPAALQAVGRQPRGRVWTSHRHRSSAVGRSHARHSKSTSTTWRVCVRYFFRAAAWLFCGLVHGRVRSGARRSSLPIGDRSRSPLGERSRNTNRRTALEQQALLDGPPPGLQGVGEVVRGPGRPSVEARGCRRDDPARAPCDRLAATWAARAVARIDSRRPRRCSSVRSGGPGAPARSRGGPSEPSAERASPAAEEAPTRRLCTLGAARRRRRPRARRGRRRSDARHPAADRARADYKADRTAQRSARPTSASVAAGADPRRPPRGWGERAGGSAAAKAAGARAPRAAAATAEFIAVRGGAADEAAAAHARR